MKKLFTPFIMLALGSNLVLSQTTIFSENFGPGSNSNPSVTAYTGYQNQAPIVFSGNADIRNTYPSTGYTDASGTGCLFIGATTTATLPEKYVTISGIDSSEYENLVLSFGSYNGLSQMETLPKVEISEDGTNWTTLSYTRNTGPSAWEYSTASGTIPSVNDLKLRFTNPVNSNVGYRIDDIKLVGTKTNLAATDIKKKQFQIYPTVVSTGIINISSNKSGIKTVKIYDTSARLLIDTKTENSIDVSKLKKGNYIINIDQNNEKESFKFIIK